MRAHTHYLSDVTSVFALSSFPPLFSFLNPPSPPNISLLNPPPPPNIFLLTSLPPSLPLPPISLSLPSPSLQVQVWRCSTGQQLQELSGDGEPVIDITPFTVNSSDYLALLTSHKLLVYKWECPNVT